MKRGAFIVIEGGEGSGKGTQINLLKKAFSDVVFTREPGGTTIGSTIRQILLDHGSKGMVPEAELMLFFADRAQHIRELIGPALEAGKNVISDRFVLSTVAYQIYGRERNSPDFLALFEKLEQVSIGEYAPDLYIILDVDPEIGIKRRMNDPKGEITRFDQEKLVFHRRVRKGFLDGAHEREYPHVRIDASRSVEEVHVGVLTAVKGMFEAVKKSQ